jgi:hypothetical protein
MQKPNRTLLGQIVNPVYFELDVKNNGNTVISNYTIAIKAHDWTDGSTYLPFDTFHASNVASPGQLPLLAGSEHSLSFTLDVPSMYADGHYYSWVVSVDATDEIIETSENDNWIESTETWWALPGTLGAGDIGFGGKMTVSIDAKTPTALPLKTPAIALGPGKGKARTRMAETPSASASTDTETASSRPFYKQRREKLKKRTGDPVDLRTPASGVQKGNTRPIQFKKPSFCVNHAQ